MPGERGLGACAGGCPCCGEQCFRGSWRGAGGHSVGILHPDVPTGHRVGRTDGGSWGGQCCWGGGCDCGGVPNPASLATRDPDTRSAAAGPGGGAGRPVSHPPGRGSCGVAPRRRCGAPPAPIPPGCESARGRGQPPPVQVSSLEAPSPFPASAVSHRPAGGPGPRRCCPVGAGPARAAPTSRGDGRGSPSSGQGVTPRAGLRGCGRCPNLAWDAIAEPRPSRPVPPCQRIRLQAFPPPREPLPENPAWNTRLRGRGLAGGGAIAGSPRGGGDPGTPQRPHFSPCPGGRPPSAAGPCRGS